MTSRITRQLKELGRAGIDKLTSSFDSWTNDVTGFGTTDDKTTYTRFMGGQLLSLQELSNVYHGDDLGARMIDVVPDEMLREGFTLELGDAGLNQAVNDKFEGLCIDEHFANGIRWGRLYGEGAILMGADDGRSPDQPLVPERARDISYLYVMDGRYYWPRSYYREAGHPKLGQPETYGVQPPAYAGQPSAVVHESRLIRFGGSPTGAQEREINLSRDYSVLQRAYEALRAFNTGWKAVEILLTDGHQSVFKMQGLAEMIGSGGEALAAARLKVINLYRSVLRAIVVDAGDKEGGIGAEDFTRNSVSFSDIPNTLDKFMLRLAAAVQIPVTILMGQSPAGMNATGESDFRWFYDRIRSEQTRKLAPKIRRLTQVLLATKNWKQQRAPKALVVNFPLLWTETPSQAAQTRSALITGDAALVTAQIALPEEIALQRLKPGGYAQELVLTDEGVKVRQATLRSELQALVPDDSKSDIPNIELAPTDAAQVIKVNEARASMSLPPLDGPDGELTLAEFAAKSAPAPGGGFGGPPGGGPPKLPPKPALAGGGAPPPFGKAGDEEAKTDADDQPRDDHGRFSETDGGGGNSSGGDSGGGGRSEPREQARRTRLAAVAQMRLQKAQAAHDKAKVEHEAAEQHFETAKAEAHAKLDLRETQRKEAAARAQARVAELDAEEKSLEKEYDQLAKQVAKEGLEDNDEDDENHPQYNHPVNVRMREVRQRLSELEEEPSYEALKLEARGNLRPDKDVAKARAAINAGDIDRLERYESAGLPDTLASDEYLGEKEWPDTDIGLQPALGTPQERAAADAAVRARWARDGFQGEPRPDDMERMLEGYFRKNPPTGWTYPENSLVPAKGRVEKARDRLARAGRAVRVHEREVKRREKPSGGGARPPLPATQQ